MKATLRFIIAVWVFASISVPIVAQQISVSNSTSCTSSVSPTTICVGQNEVNFFIESQFLPPLDQGNGNLVPRFEAFWVFGDGNYLEYTGNDVASDQASLDPPAYPYSTANGSSFKATAYITGKYTNTTPPPQLYRNVELGGRGTGPTFTPRLTTGQRMDIHSNHYRYQDPNGQTGHLVRMGNLTAFVVSYDANLSGKLYFFFNGRKNPTVPPPANFSACTTNVLDYKWTDIPKYFEKVVTDQHYLTSTLTSFSGVDYSPAFEGLSRKYRDFVVYSTESVLPSLMPTGFSEKRQFPVLVANPNAVLTTADSVMSVLALLTGPEPIDDGDEQTVDDINAILNAYGLQGLSAFSPITAPGANAPVEYIIGAAEATVYYVTGFDPNQLVVENIVPENGQYRVTFRLDICNEGQAPVSQQNVTIRYPEGAFWDFQYKGDNALGSGNMIGYQMTSHAGGVWKFDLGMELNEVPAPQPGQEHQEQCGSMYFTVLTDCEGVRSLWQENGGRVMEACVVFPQTITKQSHCGYNSAIESTKYKDANGNCICCSQEKCPPRDGGGMYDWRYCLLILLFLLLLLLWLLKRKYLPWLSKWLS